MKNSEQLKTGGSRKWIIASVAVLIAGILLTGPLLACFSFPRGGRESVETGSAQGGMSVSSGQNEHGITLSFETVPVDTGDDGAMIAYESAQTVSASVVAAIGKHPLEWSVRWENANSEWASGKDVGDYVSVVPSSDDMLKATVQCSAPFGERIILKASMVSQSDVYAEANVDYVQRLNGIELQFGTDIVCYFGNAAEQAYDAAITRVPLDIAFSGGSPKGGLPRITYKTSDVYTVTQTFTPTYTLSSDCVFLYDQCDAGYSTLFLFGTQRSATMHFTNTADELTTQVDQSLLTSYRVQQGLYFGLAYMHEHMGLNMCYANDLNGTGNIWRFDTFENGHTTEIAVNKCCKALVSNKYFYDEGSNVHQCSGVRLFKLTVSVKGSKAEALGASPQKWSTTFAVGSVA